ncbi:MAG TPA: PsbP-related protein, partial [Methanobacteriaceae archaeon]|nr:PsbP-related protein [Methanobacteriaceae archaeon]
KKKADEKKVLNKKTVPEKSRVNALSEKVIAKKGFILANKRLILIFAVIICLVIAAALIFSGKENSNPTSNLTPTSNQSTPTFNHYEDKNIAFNYPLDWNVSTDVSSPMIVTVTKDQDNLFSVFVEDLGNMTLRDKLLQWKANLNQTSNITYEQVITVDNTQAYDVQASTKINSTTFLTRGIALEKNKKVYFIVFVFNKSLLDYKDQMDLVLNSFHVKEQT